MSQGIDVHMELGQIRRAQDADVARLALGVKDAHNGDGGGQRGYDVVHGVECGIRCVSRFRERSAAVFRVGIDADARGRRGGG